MKKIENKITSLVFTIDDVVKEVSLPNTKDNIAFEIVLAKYDQSTIADIISNDSANGEITPRLTEYREWYAQAKDMVQTLNISSLNFAAKDKIEADRIEAERIAAEKAAKEAEEEAKRQAEAEEAARIEAEKREAERKEAEKKAAEVAEAARVEAERIAAEKAAKEAEERAYYEEFVAPIERFNAAKSAKLAAIEAYDVSDAVNGFSINGVSGWLDRDTRTSLTNTVSIEKAAGMTETTLWFGANSLTLNCDLVLGMLAQLEMYAHKCYNVTQQHKAEVSAMTTIEEIEAYDIETGYPEQLAF